MYVYIYIYIYTHIYMYIHIYMCTHIDRGSSVKMNHLFVGELSTIEEFEFM